MELPGQYEWKKGREGAEFHPENKTDPVEMLVEKIGWDSAPDEIMDNFEQNPDDVEARRQAALIVKLYDEKIKPLRDRLNH